MATPKSLPLGTRVFCAGCQKHYEIDTDTLMAEGFVCDCGKLRMQPRFEVKGRRGRPKTVYRPKLVNAAPARRVGARRGR